METFNGLGVGLHNAWRLSKAKSRSISAENFSGEKGGGGKATEGSHTRAARDLGQGWKVSPCIKIGALETVTLAEIDGPGAIQHLWNTVAPEWWRRLILRVYWDGEAIPSIEVPLGDFFCNGWCERCNVNSLPISVNPAGGFNSYWEMPFRKSARVTLENSWEEPCPEYFYQIDYTLTEVPEDAAYFHAQFRRNNPLPYATDHTILDGVTGQGQYVGVYMAWQSNSNGWWGEGEIKFYLDGDADFPTICGTGTEDYFGGAWCFTETRKEGDRYGVYSTPYLGMPQVIVGNAANMWRTQQRYGLYRWHVADPVRFEQNLKITMQALGWRSGGRYLPLQDDIASTAFWYQTEPHAPFPALPDRDGLEVI